MNLSQTDIMELEEVLNYMLPLDRSEYDWGFKEGRDEGIKEVLRKFGYCADYARCGYPIRWKIYKLKK